MNVHTDSRTRAAYDQWAPSYDTDPNPQTALEFEPVLAAVAPARGDRILDAGCGTGRYAAAFVRAGAHVVGVDFSEKMLAVARAKLPSIEFHVADLAGALPFEDRPFDKICCAQTLKHLPSLHSTFREFSRLLRPDGLLVFSVTHPDMVWEGYEMRCEPAFILSQESDIYHHSLTVYTDALHAAGLQSPMFEDVRVSEAIASLLTEESFARVAGRTQVMLCSVRSAA